MRLLHRRFGVARSANRTNDGVVFYGVESHKHKYLVLVATSFRPDAAGSGAELKLTPSVVDRLQEGPSVDARLSDAQLYAKYMALPANSGFLLNAHVRGHLANRANEPINHDAVAVACTCMDWKWRGVGHCADRSRPSNEPRKERALAIVGGGGGNAAADVDGLAAAAGCKHMRYIDFTVFGRVT